MSVRAQQILKLLAKVAVAVVLLAWVFSKVDFQNFCATVRTARWQYLFGVWGSTALFSSVQAVALQWILRKQGCTVSLNTIFGATCVTSLYGLVVPGFVRTGVKWYLLKRATGKGTIVLSGMLYNQIALTVVMLAVGLVGLIGVNPAHALWPGTQRAWILPLIGGIAFALLLLLSALALSVRTGALVLRLLFAALRPLPATLQEKSRTLLTQIAMFQSAGWRFHLGIAWLNIFDTVLVGLSWYLFAAWAAAAVIPIGVLIWLCAIVFLLNALQITVANLGVRESVLVSLLPAYGVPPATALLMSMILLSSLVFLAALGAVYQLLWSLRSRKPLRPA